MNKLYILRHAKAGKSNKKILDDHERPLTGTGVYSCKLIADYLKNNAEGEPELVISSTSKRTRKTFENVFKDYKPNFEAEYDPRLYLASAYDILSVIHDVEDSVSSLMVIGHNPGLHEFCLQITGEAEKPVFKSLKDFFPPASMAIFEVPEGWRSLKRKSARLIDFVIPKNLAG